MNASSVENRKAALHASLEKGRGKTAERFSQFRTTQETAVAEGNVRSVFARDKELTAMLARIKLNIPGVLYGEAEGTSLPPNLPHRASKNETLVS